MAVRASLVAALLVFCLLAATPAAWGASCAPAPKGYTLKADLNWVGSDSTVGSQTSPKNAALICNLDDNCLGWNSYGYYILKSIKVKVEEPDAGITYYAYKGMCLYMKPV
ncbi:hypothetical protein MNEG_4465 [Monoraphidium neglectum]|uniref:Uncharacterized protein n=1 Tax=Monoraphidium neglectum TaxID=145388 RepID=A0A0D2MST3_9CHLO|nr:hypothetical protein MNEG_4465 [Monoraphidium neglectum]KIZ03492.1 hypothetical protein MNEG_4465 [Monoraphidium neglectum]|eukprot:XP_013902511.1 hypothetical protein MNEG_4465 [Monoraphidium neglectum]